MVGRWCSGWGDEGMTTATEPKVHRMKYKHIDSVLRNFGHSFASLMNYVDDVYICDLLDAAARDS